MAGKLILNSTQQSRSDQNMKQTHNIKAIILAAEMLFLCASRPLVCVAPSLSKITGIFAEVA